MERFLPRSVVLGGKKESNKFLLLASDNRAMLAETFPPAHPKAWSLGRSPRVGGLEDVLPGDFLEQIMDKLYEHRKHRQHLRSGGPERASRRADSFYPNPFGPSVSSYRSDWFSVPEPPSANPFRPHQFNPDDGWSQRCTPSPPPRGGRLIIRKPETTIVLHPLVNMHLLPLSQRRSQTD